MEYVHALKRPAGELTPALQLWLARALLIIPALEIVFNPFGDESSSLQGSWPDGANPPAPGRLATSLSSVRRTRPFIRSALKTPMRSQSSPPNASRAVARADHLARQLGRRGVAQQVHERLIASSPCPGRPGRGLSRRRTRRAPLSSADAERLRSVRDVRVTREREALSVRVRPAREDTMPAAAGR